MERSTFEENFDREKLVKDYLSKHSGIIFACFNLPLFMKKNFSEEDLIRQNNNHSSNIIEKVFGTLKTYVDKDGIRRMEDQQQEMVSIVRGHRITKSQPSKSKRKLFLVGGENVFGIGVKDANTIASYLQELFQEYLPEEDIFVENYGQNFEDGITYKELKNLLYELPVCPQGGDIILWNTEQISGVPFINMKKTSVVTRKDEIFFNEKYYTPQGYKLIADQLFQGLLLKKLLPVSYLQGNERLDYLPSIKESGLSLCSLREENDFRTYLKKLKDFAKKYTICIVSNRTPCGKGFSEKESNLLKDLGLKVNLIGKENYAYAAIIDEGKCFYEKLSSEPSKTVGINDTLMGNKIELNSYSRGAKENNKIYIKWNGSQTISFINETGLFFVVYDKINQFVLDSVSFNVFARHIPCFRAWAINDKIKNWLIQHPGVIFSTVSGISFPEQDFTKNEKYIIENKTNSRQITKVLNDSKFKLHTYYDNEEIVEVINVPKSYHDNRGVRRFFDKESRCVNIMGGHRVTAFQPKKPKRTLYLVGGCNVYGVGNRDDHTMASNLQKILNQKYPEEEIIVQNYGYFLMESEDARSNDQIKILEALPVKSGDIVLWDKYISPDILHLNVSSAAKENRDIEVFFEIGHYTPDGHKLWAEKIYEKILEHGLLTKAKGIKILPENKFSESVLDENNTGELTEYKRELANLYKDICAGGGEMNVIGSIVMNCNPFTLGHRYVIEQALKQCDYLIIFVVEEERSFFSFEDRLQLVIKGIADLTNVRVIPSGKFIISSLTFSEYFNKAELQEREVDTSMDVLLFAQEIAPCLHIQKRFAGEEPFDAVTRQYNETMEKILPEYGIEFIEIPRVKVNEKVISASRVRALLKKKDFEEISTIVPESTFSYLFPKYR